MVKVRENDYPPSHTQPRYRQINRRSSQKRPILMETSTLWVQICYYAQQVWNFLAYKLGIAAVFSSMVDQSDMLTVLLLLFVTDFICGVSVAYRLRSVSSSAMRRGLAKGFLYLAFISTVSMTENAVSGTSIATGVAIGILIFTESLSVIENLVNLGLPLPFARKVMRALASKAKLIGVDLNIEDIGRNINLTNDVQSMIRVHIPRLKSSRLEQVMRVFYLNWFDFLRTLDEDIVSSRPELSWERLRTSLEETITNAFEASLREGVDRSLATAFFHEWNASSIQSIYSKSRGYVFSSMSPSETIDSVASHIVMVLYQILNRSALWDRSLQNGASMPHGAALQDFPGAESGAHPVIIRKSTTIIRDGEYVSPSPLEPDSGGYQALDIDALEPLTDKARAAQATRDSVDPSRTTILMTGKNKKPNTIEDETDEDMYPVDDDPLIR